MEIDDVLPPLPLEPPLDLDQNAEQAPPPPPLQTSSDAEVMDVSSGGDGYTSTPGDDQLHPPLSSTTITFSNTTQVNPIPLCPRTARHAPPITKFLPDLKLLKDVKIRVSFAESSSSTNNNTTVNNKDRKILYTGERQEADDDFGSVNGQLQDLTCDGDGGEGTSGNIAGKLSEENEVDMENRVEYAVLDEFEDFYENFVDADNGGFGSGIIAQQEQADDEAVAFPYEVCLSALSSPTYDCINHFHLQNVNQSIVICLTQKVIL